MGKLNILVTTKAGFIGQAASTPAFFMQRLALTDNYIH